MESMILLVDSGATKAEWCVLDGSDVRDRFVTPGLNLSTQTQEATSAILQEAVTRLKSQGGRIREVHFFGAGLLDGDTSPLQALFPGADIEAASDLLAAARAVCGREPGIACILGTGSNSCLYDGKQIVRNVHPCGFILGDEGSAACLGKRFIGAFLKGWVPEAVAKAFSAVHEADYQTVVQHVYRGEAPSRYLGSFAPWILQWYGGDPWMTKLIEDNLRDFVEGFLRQYDPARYPVGVVGGFGAACEPILRALAPDLTFSRFLARPMDGLIAYYSK